MGHAIAEQLLEALSGAATLLTPNQRAARALRRAFDAVQTAPTWQPPAIFALDTWLETLWHQALLTGLETRLLLNSAQEQALWRRIIAADLEQAPSLPSLRSPEALAELAAQAWRLLSLANGRARLRDFSQSADTRAFARWAGQFERLCTRTACLPAAQLPEALLPHVAELALPPALLLVDFDHLQPAYTRLFDALHQTAIESFRTSIASRSAQLYSAPDAAAEMQAAALWASELLALKSDTSIAIVVPGLDRKRPQIDRIFTGIVSPGAFEFSLGRPLAETPLVSAALALLRWPFEPLPLTQVSALLLSPFFGAAHPEEAQAAAEFDAFDLRGASLLRPELTLQGLLDVLRPTRRAARLPRLLRSLFTLRKAAAEHRNAASASYASWADLFRNLLEAAGHSSAVESDSLTFQTERSFESALDQLATLDFDAARVALPAALAALTRICQQTIFAPESRSAPIQILGPLEPAAVAFDALWFLGADDRSWPPSSSTHPLIPWHIQRELRLPGADFAHDTELARRLTARLVRTAPAVVFSYAAHNEDAHLSASPLLRALSLTPSGRSLTLPLPAPVPLEEVPDDEPLAALPDAVLPGGTRVLELQAACAFRGFAEIRLRASSPAASSPGLDPKARGIQVHRILQSFWTGIGSQQALAQMSAEARDTLLRSAIEEHLDPTSEGPAHRDAWDRAYLEVQRLRLRDLLLPWLDIELARPPFVVRQQEERQQARIGPLTLAVQADRIDDTAYGPVILDYKTGQATPADWLSERPSAPQLPLYAVVSEQPEPIAGVAFALISAGDKLKLTGLGTVPDLLPNHLPKGFLPMPAQIEDWKRILTSLAVSFAEDHPTTNPKDFPATCKHCGQRILCRLQPTTLQLEAEQQAEQFPETDAEAEEFAAGV